MTSPSAGTESARGFVVSWHVDVYADNAHHAALIAAGWMREPHPPAAVFDVCADDDGHTITVDITAAADPRRLAYPAHDDALNRRCVWSDVPVTGSSSAATRRCPKGCLIAMDAGPRP